MSYAYAQKKRMPAQTDTRSSGGMVDTAVPNSARLAALEAGQIAPTAADKGRRVDLPEAQRRKMESSFGMDFSGVKLYESEVLGQTGAEAMAQGNEIAFAPGKFDLASQEGQARLGHELSHVASQARGEVHANGFLFDGGLEARADREGAMAARGESVYGDAYGGAVAPLSNASAAPMAGPMQAKGSNKERKNANKASMEAAIKAEGMKKGDQGYDEAQNSKNNFINTVASTSLDEADEFSAEGVFNAEWSKVNEQFERELARKGRVSDKLAKRYGILNRLKTQMVSKRLENTLSGYDIQDGEEGYENAQKMRKDYIQRAAQGGSDKDLDVGANFASKLRGQETLRSNYVRDGGNRMSHHWKPEQEDRYNKFQDLKANLDAFKSGQQAPQGQKYVPSVRQNQQADASQKNAQLEKILKMNRGDQKVYVNRMANGNDEELSEATDALNEEYGRLSVGGVDQQTGEKQMGGADHDRFMKLYNLKDDIRKEEGKQRMLANRKQREDEFDAQKNAMLAKMAELDLDDE